MPHELTPGQFAGGVRELTQAAHQSTELKQRIEQVTARLFGLSLALVVEDSAEGEGSLPLTPPFALRIEPAAAALNPQLQAFLTVAGSLLGQELACERATRDHDAVLTRLDQLKRDMDNVARSEWIALERLRIAQDLHDRVAQTLFGLGLTADWILTHLDADEPILPDVERIKQMASTGLRQVRESIFALSSGPVEAGQLTVALRALLRDLDNAGIVGDLHVQGDLTLLPPDVTDAVYQIVREALVNVRRHAQASSALVSIRVQPDQVKAVIQDDGCGIQPTVLDTFRKSGAHLGLRGMESRAERLGGSLSLAPGDECGLIVTIAIPLKGVKRDV